VSDAASDSPVVSFDNDIKPLFRASDRAAMIRAFDLWSYEDVVTHSAAIAERIQDGSMPCDGAWPDEHVSLFDRWIAEGSAR
jgi:hypothetical protein